MDFSTCGAAQERLAKLVGKNSPSGSSKMEETVVVPRWSGSGQDKGDLREPKLGLNRKIQAVCSDVASFRFLSNAPSVLVRRQGAGSTLKGFDRLTNRLTNRPTVLLPTFLGPGAEKGSKWAPKEGNEAGSFQLARLVSPVARSG
jgi:hypothetical protein